MSVYLSISMDIRAHLLCLHWKTNNQKKSLIERKKGNKSNDLNEKTMNEYFTDIHSHISSNETKEEEKKELSRLIYVRNHFTFFFRQGVFFLTQNYQNKSRKMK